MKLYSLTLIILLTVLSKNLLAQNTPAYKHGISAGYGFLPVQDLVSITSDVLIAASSDVDGADVTSSGAVNLGYSYYRSKHWRFLADANYVNVKCNYTEHETNQLYAKGNDKYYSLMVGFNYHWIGDSFLELYSGLELGAGYVNTEQEYSSGEKATANSIVPAFQVNALGARIGKKFGGFAEVGFGNKGLLNLGLDLRF